MWLRSNSTFCKKGTMNIVVSAHTPEIDNRISTFQLHANGAETSGWNSHLEHKLSRYTTSLQIPNLLFTRCVHWANYISSLYLREVLNDNMQLIRTNYTHSFIPMISLYCNLPIRKIIKYCLVYWLLSIIINSIFLQNKISNLFPLRMILLVY